MVAPADVFHKAARTAAWLRRKDTIHWAVPAAVSAIVVGEVILSVCIFLYVPYTKIDWQAYMEQVKLFLDGERDYAKIRGETGPLVYPAGFVYVFTLLRCITRGGDERSAQACFLVLYLAMQGAVVSIYLHSPMWRRWRTVLEILLLCVSRRVHSIFILRCFNDGVAMLLAFMAIAFFQRQRTWIGATLFSFAVSVKMNILLMAPGLAFHLLRPWIVESSGLGSSDLVPLCEAIAPAVWMGLIQILLASPFLVKHPVHYVTQAFNFGRVFTLKWSVNFQFLSEEVFVSKQLAFGLLLIHVTVLVWMAVFRWRRLASMSIVSLLFMSNFIGVCFARSLHYQFYAWYYSTLPWLLLRCCHLPSAAVVFVMAVIEFVMNCYPQTAVSSLTLQLSHITILCVLLRRFGRLEESPSINRKLE